MRRLWAGLGRCAPLRGFTLVEIAIVLVVLGIITSVLVPPLVTSVKKEKTTRAKGEVTSLKNDIIGYAMVNKRLPAAASDAGQASDVWGNTIFYGHDTDLETAPVGDNIVLCNSTSGYSVTVSGRTVSNVAFIVASRGENGAQDGTYGATSSDISSKGDDLTEFVTMDQLRSFIYCPQSEEEEEEEEQPTAPAAGDINFSDDFSDFDHPAAGGGIIGSGIDTDSGTQTINMGSGGIFGLLSENGCLWYDGNEAAGNCTAGNCATGTGFRLFFRFVENGQTDAEGWTFAVVNGNENDISDCAGYGPYYMSFLLGTQNYIRAEYLGYAGRDSDGNEGLLAPKLAIEFDTARNANSGPCDVPGGLFGLGWDGSRRDQNHDHMSFMYWGESSPGLSCGDAADDNVHNRGTDANPTSEPLNQDHNDSGYYRDNGDWLQGTQYSMRFEMHVNATASEKYTLKAWLIETATEFTGMDDMSTDYSGAIAPTITDSFNLDATTDAQFDKFLFGWTKGSTLWNDQDLTLSGFRFAFRSRS